MVELSLVLPIFIRAKPGFINKILRFEQEGEHLHQLLNVLEAKYKSSFPKQTRYFLMLEEYENKLYSSKNK